MKSSRPVRPAAVKAAAALKRDATGSDATGSDASGSDASGWDASGSDASGSDASGSDASGGPQKRRAPAAKKRHRTSVGRVAQVEVDGQERPTCYVLNYVDGGGTLRPLVTAGASVKWEQGDIGKWGAGTATVTRQGLAPTKVSFPHTSQRNFFLALSEKIPHVSISPKAPKQRAARIVELVRVAQKSPSETEQPKRKAAPKKKTAVKPATGGATGKAPEGQRRRLPRGAKRGRREK